MTNQQDLPLRLDQQQPLTPHWSNSLLYTGSIWFQAFQRFDARMDGPEGKAKAWPASDWLIGWLGLRNEEWDCYLYSWPDQCDVKVAITPHETANLDFLSGGGKGVGG